MNGLRVAEAAGIAVVAALVAALARILGDSGARERMARAGRQVLRDHFDVTNAARRTMRRAVRA